MDANASPTYADLQTRVRELEARDPAHVAEKESLLHIATEAVQALALQAPPIEPAGFWIRDRDAASMTRVQELGLNDTRQKKRPEDGWLWQTVETGTRESWLPIFPARTVWSLSDHVAPKVYEVKPFLREFPLELFQAIIAMADTQSISRTARASYSCYQLFLPVLLNHIVVSSFQDVCGLFSAHSKTIPRSSRLNLFQASQRVRSLTISSSSLKRSLNVDAFDLAHRLAPRSGVLELDVLILLVDESSPGPTFVLILQTGEDVLAYLEPATLVVRAGPAIVHNPGDCYQWTYIVRERAALAMTRWTRLRHVCLEQIDLLCEGVVERFFLSILDVNGQSLFDEPEKISIVWELPCTNLPNMRYVAAANFLDALSRRDDILQQPWLKSFTVAFATDESAEEFKTLVENRKEDALSRLKWEVKSKPAIA